MLIVIPVCEKEIPLAEKLSAHITKLGGLENHSVLVVGSISTAGKLDTVLTNLPGAAHFTLESENEEPWPVSANFTFASVVSYLARTGNTLPWYFFEVDNTPLRSTWADEVETEYNQGQKPYLGAVQDAVIRDPVTREVKGKDGEFVVGSAVYPADFAKRSIVWRYLRDIPWDVHLRWEIRPSATPSKTIQSNWKSYNYTRAEDGRIVCDGLSSDSVTDPILPTTAVLHGCKDGSLIDILNEKPKKEKK